METGKNILLSLLEQLVCLLDSMRSGSQSQRGLPFTLPVLINQISAIFVITIDWPVLRVLYPLTCRLHGKVAMEFKLPVLTARLFVAHTPGRAGVVGCEGVELCVLGFIRGEYPWTPLPRPCGLQRMQ